MLNIFCLFIEASSESSPPGQPDYAHAMTTHRTNSFTHLENSVFK